jgi:hypothetical protein
MPLTVHSSPRRGACVRRQLIARLTLLVGIFCVFSQVSGALHWVLVEHARCAEHGEWAHVGEGEHAHSDAPTAPASVSVQAGGTDEHGHDHCDFLRTPRELTLAPSARALLPVPRVVGSSGQVRCSDSKATIARYELAPKTSPPAYES